MKTKHLLLAGTLMCAAMANAQNVFNTAAGTYVGIGTLSPGFPLDLYTTSLSNNGIRITQSGTQGPAALWLDNATTGGRNWTLYSLGANDAPGAGNFIIADNSSGGGNRFFIYGGGATNPGYTGINTTTPGNRLEIKHGTSGNSGLRFTNLTSGNTPGTNPGSGLLALNSSGDVVYVNDNGLGNSCAGTAHALTSSWEIPMATNNFMFNETNQGGASQVGIGHTTASCGNTIGKLEVLNDLTGNGTKTAASYNQNSSNGTRAIGVAGAMGNSISTVNTKISGFTAGTTIGVYGYNDYSNSTGISWAGYFDGDVKINGSGTTTYALTVAGSAFSSGTWTSSDKRYKKDIKQLESVSSKLMKLNGYTYNFKTDEFREKNFDKGEQIGFIAQELKEVFPQLVNEGKDGYMAVNYQGMVPVLVEAIKEQNAQSQKQSETIQNQQKQIDELKAMVQSMANGRAVNGQTVELSTRNVVVLDQNVPNPFAESTVISYNISTDFVKAQIIFSSSEGRVIKAIDITGKGAGTLNVFANDLTSGVYTYSLVVDGKVIDTKKMVKN